MNEDRVSKHTPGPWEAFILDMPIDQVSEYTERCIKASGGTDYYFVKAGDVDICHVGNGPKGPVNAHLISAAPDLLEALALMLAGVDGTTDECGAAILEIARAALAKARGEKND